MSYVAKNLLNDERIAYRTKLHWKLYVLPTVIAVFILLPLAYFALQSQLQWWWALLPLALIAVVYLPASLKRMSSEFAVTNKRVLMKVGVLNTRSVELLLGKVEAIAVNQRVWGKMLNYGDIVVTGSGGTHEPFAGIQDPLKFRNAVQAVSDPQLSSPGAARF